MSKTSDQILILPGETGWEIWVRTADGSYESSLVSDLQQAGDLVDIPAAELTMLFAVKAVTAVPMRVMTAEDAMFADLVTLHSERLGLRSDPLAGQLNDVFVVEREPESTVLLALFLKPPVDGELPTLGPKAFDLSARAMPVDGDAVVVWKELGRWVFAIHQGGHLWYAQATANGSIAPDAQFAREVKLALMQLSMQGMEMKPRRIDVWASDPACDLSALRDAFELPVQTASRPQPVLPQPMSKLLPEDVRAARRTAQRRQRITLSVLAGVALYVGLIGWFGFGLWQGARDVRDLETRAKAAAPEADAYTAHMMKWNELSDAIDLDHAPVDILYRIASCIPPQGGLRLKLADISAYEVTLVGEAPELQAVNRFSLKLTKHSGLSRYDWNTPEPKQSTLGWEFRYQGIVPAQGGTP